MLPPTLLLSAIVTRHDRVRSCDMLIEEGHGWDGITTMLRILAKLRVLAHTWA
jgi:hypothetical protein